MKKRNLLLAVGAAALALGMARKLRQLDAAEALWTESGTSSPRGTALITGASSGIGAAFARQLAARGCNLVLVARRLDKLTALQKALADQYQIEVEVLAADLTKVEDIQRVEARIGEIGDLTYLINNAGFGTSGKFAESEPQKQFDMVELHVDASVRLCRAALPGMTARHHGNIINTASLAAFLALPGNVTYGATKAFLVTFSEALALELRDTGVQVQALCPGFTYSEFHDNTKIQRFERLQIPAFLWMSAEQVAAGSLHALAQNQAVYVPGLVNKALALVQRSGIASLAVNLMADRLESSM